MCPPLDRRSFLRRAATCAAPLAALSSLPAAVRAAHRPATTRFPVVRREPWARIEQVGEGVWAVISTPLEDRTTLCNGGIVAGDSGVLVVETFGSERGAQWVLDQARELADRDVSHAVVTHYHGDHVAGLAAVHGQDVEILMTGVTRTLVAERNTGAPTAVLDAAREVRPGRPTEVDLGGKRALLVPRRGHTPSDLSVEVQDPDVAFCGDLVWNGMVPNYMDATPSRLGMEVRLLRERGAATYVPGHGELAIRSDLDPYLALLDEIGAAAERARTQGSTAAQAADRFEPPPEVADWVLFNPAYYERAIEAWFKEWEEAA